MTFIIAYLQVSRIKNWYFGGALLILVQSFILTLYSQYPFLSPWDYYNGWVLIFFSIYLVLISLYRAFYLLSFLFCAQACGISSAVHPYDLETVGRLHFSHAACVLIKAVT